MGIVLNFYVTSEFCIQTMLERHWTLFKTEIPIFEQRKSYDKPTHIAQTEEPWSHLHSSSTVASTQRSAAHKHGVSSTQLGSHTLSTDLKTFFQLTLSLFLILRTQ